VADTTLSPRVELTGQTSPGLHSGTYGLKPTLKLVDGRGIIPITYILGRWDGRNSGMVLTPSRSRQDCAGPMGKSVWDLATLLSSMVVPHTDYTQYLASPNNSLSSYRLGVARGPGFFPFSYSSGLKDDPHAGYPESEALFDDALRLLAPAIALDPAEIPGSETIWERDDEQSCFEDGKWKGRREVLLMVTDMYEDFNTYLAGLRNTSIRTLEDLVGWNKLHPVSTGSLPAHGLDGLMALSGPGVPVCCGPKHCADVPRVRCPNPGNQGGRIQSIPRDRQRRREELCRYAGQA
jgi:hypothetical protein